ncbi:MAG: NTE family protein, partial [Thalassolituus oleivorans]
QDSPKIGLVLSGGGAKGLAHVGVLRVLESEGIQVDVIAGTSMGAIIGGLYAMGYSADDLTEMVSEIDWAPLFTDGIDRKDLRLEQRTARNPILLAVPSKDLLPRLPGGIVQGQEAMTLLSRLSWDYHDVVDLTKLPIPFVGVATDLRTGKPKGMSDQPLADVLRASMSLPTIFSPARMGGQQYIDGGMSRNLPATEALNLGADILIGVDVGLLPEDRLLEDASLLDVMQLPWWYQGYRSDVEQRNLIDVLISPDVAALPSLDFEMAGEFIRLGEEAARAALPELRTLLGDSSQDAVVMPRTNAPRNGPKEVRRIDINGVEGRAEQMVRQRLGLDVPAVLIPKDVEGAIARVYGTGLFETVTYRILPDSGLGNRLSVQVVPADKPDRIGLGLRYDTSSNLQALVSVTLRNRIRYDSSTEFHVRVGRQGQAGGSFTSRLGRKNLGLIRVSASYSTSPLSLFLPKPFVEARAGNTDLPEYKVGLTVVGGEILGALVVSDAVMLGISAEADLVRVRREMGSIAASSQLATGEALITPGADHAVATLGAVLQVDSFDRRSFPSSGSRVHADIRAGLASATQMQSQASKPDSPWFRTARLEVEQYVAISPRVSLFGRGIVSLGEGEALPISRQAFLGGEFPNSVLPGSFLPLVGMRDQGRFGRKAWTGLMGVQWQLPGETFARIFANVGDTYDQVVDNEESHTSHELFKLLDEPPFFGFAGELGMRTPMGPIRLILSSDAQTMIPNFGLSLGYAL